MGIEFIASRSDIAPIPASSHAPVAKPSLLSPRSPFASPPKSLGKAGRLPRPSLEAAARHGYSCGIGCPPLSRSKPDSEQAAAANNSRGTHPVRVETGPNAARCGLWLVNKNGLSVQGCTSVRADLNVPGLVACQGSSRRKAVFVQSKVCIILNQITLCNPNSQSITLSLAKCKTSIASCKTL